MWTPAKDAALYETGVSAAYGDKLITLSTCDDSGRNSRGGCCGKAYNRTEVRV